MPKKTRRQKLVADHRRTLSTPHQDTPVTPQTFQFRVVHTAPLTPRLRESALELAVIRRDLVKTLLLATVALAAEFALYVKLH